MEKQSHTLLVVATDPSIKKIFNHTFCDKGIKVEYTDSGENGTKIIDRSPFPFSTIFYDLQLPGMMAHDFFSKIEQQSPSSIRFLLAGPTQFQDIIPTINKGHVHKILKKPLTTGNLLNAVADSLEQFELIQEANTLLKTAKRQNQQLYSLKKDLMEKIKNRQHSVSELNRTIVRLEKKLKDIHVLPEKQKEMGWKQIGKILKSDFALNQDQFNSLYISILTELTEQLINTSTGSTISLNPKDLWE